MGSIAANLLALLEDKKPRWLRVAIPAVIFLIILFTENDLRRADLVIYYYAIAISVFSGWIFYNAYYFVIHRFIRFFTFKLFGLPTCKITIRTVRTQRFSSSLLEPFMLQDVIAQFFTKNPQLRNARVMLRNSVFHGLYMTTLIMMIYAPYKLNHLGPAYYFGVLIFLVFVMLGAMWCDKTFGENEECLIINSNLDLFKSHLNAYGKRIRRTSTKRGEAA